MNKLTNFLLVVLILLICGIWYRLETGLIGTSSVTGIRQAVQKTRGAEREVSSAGYQVKRIKEKIAEAEWRLKAFPEKADETQRKLQKLQKELELAEKRQREAQAHLREVLK